ncbi:MAG: hypothetical protein Ct9H300mP1_14370 [Planctomycetaceae bacterium]|nr:MAG: hypothetical protein Ct9H300mP1_14370 [Planctomycetaceae bacterium]
MQARAPELLSLGGETRETLGLTGSMIPRNRRLRETARWPGDWSRRGSGLSRCSTVTGITPPTSATGFPHECRVTDRGLAALVTGPGPPRVAG